MLRSLDSGTHASLIIWPSSLAVCTDHLLLSSDQAAASSGRCSTITALLKTALPAPSKVVQLCGWRQRGSGRTI
ncbi:hypothetical protein EJ06DRAFT_526160 [Trichodelitschia bisporula]|uniref:Uncharacterized protein n=1 Tax=Trichodelitschia bisporula TaxID=703511 RepID=A0A6G1IC53_9PEZI|nr:hypothetical protein EJ06DRAFT_526160 [Trichodelitschia bisporula]